MQSLSTPLQSLLLFVWLPCMLGLCLAMARDACKRDRRYNVTGAGWLEELTDGGKTARKGW